MFITAALVQNINRTKSQLPLMVMERNHKIVKQFPNISPKSEQLLFHKMKVVTNTN